MMRRRPSSILALALLLATGLVLPAAAEDSGRSGAWEIVAPAGHQLSLPFSPGVRAGDFLYLSGALGNVPGTTEVPGGIAEQTRRTLDNLEAVLATAGLDLTRVVEARLYIADIRWANEVLEVYRERMPEPRPAAVVVEAEIAIPAALAEIGFTAALPGVTREAVTPEGWPTADDRSAAIRAGDTVFLSGMASDRRGHFDDPDSAADQVTRAMERMGEVLSAAGVSYQNVVSCNVYLAEPRDFAALNSTYPEFFAGAAAPARATVRARLGQPGQRVEVSCVAVDGERRAVLPEGATPRPVLSSSIQVGERLFLSGMVGRDASGSFPKDIALQTTAVLDNLEATLTAAGLGFDDVVSATVFLDDIRHYGAMNAVYAERLGTPAPARATVGTQLMTPDAWVEIQMIARSVPADE